MLSDIKNDLLEAGKDEGCITFQHLNELLPDQVKDPGAIEELFDFLGENNIEIVTQEKSGKRMTLASEEVNPVSNIISLILLIFIVCLRANTNSGSNPCSCCTSHRSL